MDYDTAKKVEPKKWRKLDIAIMVAQIETWILVTTPLHGVMGPTPDENDAVDRKHRAMLADPAARKEVVLAGLRSARDLVAARYRSDCETIGNALVRNIYGEGRDAFLVRFIGLAKEHDRSHATLEAMVIRVHNEGLPAEVLAFDPFAKRKR